MITNLEASFVTPALTQRIGTAIGWWNPNVTGPSNQVPISGAGKYMYLDGGKRFAIGKYPKNVKLFDPTNSIATLRRGARLGRDRALHVQQLPEYGRNASTPHSSAA